MHIDIIAELQRRSVERASTELQQSFDQYDVPIGADVKVAEIKAAAERIKREFSDIRAELKLDVDQGGFDRAKRGFKNVENAAGSAETAVNKFLGSVLNLRGPTALIGGGAAILADGLIQVVEQATAATQALWLLPAAGVAAGAGIGTLALATQDFAQTIKDIRDPKKFATDIQTLGPAAQQAALSIQNLLPSFDGLKRATEDAFFNNMGEQINRLATTYLPTIQSLTTSIAGSFNQMMAGVANQLMTPETQASMQTMFANIQQAFQNLAPAAQPLVKALTDIATVGSGFLPELATSITNAANSFATFISNARESGQLAVWIQQGIDAVKNLATAASELIQIFYHAFGPEPQANIQSNIVGVSALKETVASYGADVRKISDIIGLVTGDTHTWKTKTEEELASMQGPLGHLRDWWLDIPEAMAKAFNSVKHVIDNSITNLVNDLNHIADILPDAANKSLFGTEHPKPFSFTPASDAPSGGDWAPWRDTRPPPAPTGPYSDQGYSNRGPNAPGPQTWTDPKSGQKMVLVPRLGWVPEGDPRAANPGSPAPGPLLPVPPPPPGTTAAGGKPSDRERLDAIKAGLDPNSYKVDPFAPVPGLPSPGALAGGPMPGGGYGAASAQDFFAGQQDVITKAHDLEEKRKDRLALEQDNQHTAEQINDAKWKEHQAEVDLQKAQAALVDKTKGTAQALKTSTEALSAGLDPDLGLSKGLSGFVDNMVRFAGHMALAGPMAQMNQTVNANAAATGITGGYGLLGIQGAQNLSQGLSPLLGQPMDTTGTGTSAAPTLGSTVGGIATGGAGYAGDAALLSHVPATGTYNSTAKDLSLGLADCSSAVEDLVNIMDGKSTAGGSLTTANAAQLLPGMGFQRGMGGPGDMRIGYNSGHMQATLPGGTPFNYGAESTIDNGGVGSQGADDPAFTDHWFRPAGAGPVAPGGAGAGGLGGGGGVVPVYVTNMGGGSLPGLGGGGAPPGGGGAAGRPPMPTGGATGGSPGALANMIYQQAIGRGYSPHDAQSIVAYAIGESSLNPGVSGGVQGGAEVQGLFQEKGAFAQGGGIDPSQRTDPVANTYAYLNQLEKNRHLPIEQALPATSVGGPLASGPGAQPQAWGPLMQQAQNYLGGAGSAVSAPSPGKPGFTPGTGYVDSAGNPTGYNPGAGMSGGIPAVGGGTAGGPGPSMGIGGALGTVPPTQYGGVEPPSNPGGGGMGITPGGTIDSAMQMAASAFPGVGQAAATGMKLANRAIQYGGQMAGIGVEGLMQTFLPTGGSELASNSWLTRIVGGLAGASPALPNMAGKQTKDAQAQAPLTPQQVTSGGAPGVGTGLGAPITINYANNGATEDRAAADIAHHLAQQNQPNAIAGHR